MIELIGTVSTILAIAGVILNNRRLRTCFLLWLISNSLSLIIHTQTGVWSLVARDGIFLILAIEGWIKWGRKSKKTS
jgi:nicotinamide riboside transporter PnuC